MDNIIQQNTKRRNLIWCIFAVGLLIRLVIAYVCKGYQGDISNYTYWSDIAFKDGISSFYRSEVYTNCTPGNVYLLYIIGAIRSLFHIEAMQGINLVIVKLPAILFDLLTAGMIFTIAKKKCKYSIGLTGLYLLNPAILINSVVWGQYDSIYTLFLLLMGYFIWKKKIGFSYIAFSLALLFNVNVLIVLPILVIATYLAIKNKQCVNGLLYNVASCISLVVLFLITILPLGFSKTIHTYVAIRNQYNYTSMNAFNLWGLLDLNLIPSKERWFGISFETIGHIFLLAAVMVGLVVYMKVKEKEHVILISMVATLLLSYSLTVNINERYFYPCIVLLFLIYLFEQRKIWITSYILVSIAYCINLITVLIGTDYTVIYTLGAIYLLSCVGYIIYNIVMSLNTKAVNKQVYSIKEFFNITKKQQTVVKSKITRRLDKKDFIAIASITVVYALIAFYDLGGRVVPTTYQTLTDQERTIIIDTGKKTNLKKLAVYFGEARLAGFTLEQSDEVDGDYTFICDHSMKGIFKWDNTYLENCTGRYYRLTATCKSLPLAEIVLFDENGDQIKPVVDSANARLFDEQDTYGEGYSKDNSTYFDEIYYARTVYNIENDLPWYESTHPPLGKIIMALGVKLFGLNPFGWRFMGNVFGIMMVPLFYLIVNRLFRKQFLNIVLTIIFSFDFMHFVQTRLATIDVFVTFFIMAMYYFMMVYCDMSFYDKKLSKTLIPLGLSGICMGLAIASKWTGAYAAAGLAVLFFRQMWIRYKEWKLIEDSKFYKKLVTTLAFCVLFFIVIPVGIYTASYIPFRDSTSDGVILRMINNQKWMFSYHSQLKATHPFSSKWYQWPLMDRPIFYYSKVVNNGVKEGISAFGNPLVWWVGIPAFVLTLWNAIKKRDKVGGTIVIGYLSQFLPWVLITRCTFIYHYFPSVPFVVLMIGYCMKQALDKYETLSKKVIIAYTVGVVALFALFYPVLSGQPVSDFYVQWFLKWFDSWVLV